MSWSQNQNREFPFTIWSYTLLNTSSGKISGDLGAPDFVNGVLAAQPAFAKQLITNAENLATSGNWCRGGIRDSLCRMRLRGA